MAKRRGRHPINALTPTKIKRLAKPGRYADGGGLYLVVTESGSKHWVLRTIVRRRRKDIGLGGASHDLGGSGTTTLKEAREAARQARQIAHNRGDPLAERRKAKEVPTFEELAGDVYKRVRDDFHSAKHTDQWISSLRTYVFPIIGGIRINRLTRADIFNVLSPIWNDGKRETTKRVRQRIERVFLEAEDRGYRPAGDNPAMQVRRSFENRRKQGGGKKQHYAWMHYKDVPTFIRNLRTGASSPSVKLALEWTVLTAARTGEVIGATLDEIDFAERVWTIPAERMKAGAEHRVPLNDRCVEIAEQARQLGDGSVYLFPGNRRGRPLSNIAMWRALKQTHSDMTVHGFRASFKTWADEKTHHPQHVSESALAHTISDQVKAAYTHGQLLEKRKLLMDEWADFVLRTSATEEGRAGAADDTAVPGENIVPMRA